MESEQSQNFNERLSQWVANQGFWFQVRYSLSGSGSGGTMLYHLMRLGLRLLVFVVIAAAGTWIYLLKRTESPKFTEAIQSSIQSSFSGVETQVSGFSRKKGHMDIGRLIGEGGSQTFYNSFQAKNIRCKMGVLNGVIGTWDPGPISVSTLNIELRPGADDAESATAFSEALFRQNDRFLANTIEVADATLFWGYTERTRGSIENSKLLINRIGSGWRMTFSGGTFSQNWLRELEIVNLVAMVDPDGVRFEKAEFRRGRGEVDLSGLELTGGEKPTVTGTAKIRTLPLEYVLPPVLRDFLEGTFSGEFKLSGSTNSAEGIGFDGLVSIDGQDSIILRERIHLLEAFSVVDYVRNYHRLELQEGSFRLKTGNGEVRISDLRLKSEDIFTLEGELLVRGPTDQEKKEDSAKIDAGPDDSFSNAKSEFTLKASDVYQFGLAQDVKVSGTEPGSEVKKASSPLVARLEAARETRQREEHAAEHAVQYLRYEGSFMVTLLPDAFELAPRLLEQFPIDPGAKRIPIRVPIHGTIFELTEKQAKDILQKRTR